MTQAAMSIAADAGTVAKRLGEFKSTHGSVIDGSSTEYKQLRSAMSGVRRELEKAIAFDDQKSSSFWQEVGEFFSHGFNYWADKARFEQEVEALKRQARANVDLLEETLEPAYKNLGVPDRIGAELAEWQTVNGVTRSVAAAVPSYQQIQGWQGPAANDYGVMAGVQVEAMTEFADLPEAMTLLLGNVRQFNEVVLGATHGYVSGTQAEASVRVPSGPKEFYANTANVDNLVRQCIADVVAAFEMADLEVNEAAEKVSRVAASPVVIAGSWPSGMSQAGTSAGTVQYDAHDGDIAAPQPAAPVSEGDAVDR